MKSLLILLTITLLSTFNGTSAQAACSVSMDFNLFSNPWAKVENTKSYGKIPKILKRKMNMKVEDSTNTRFHLKVEAGIETYGASKTLLSHYQLINSSERVVLDEYKTRKYTSTKVISAEKVVRFAKRHIRRTINKKYSACK